MRRYVWPILIIVALALVHLYILTRSVSLKYDITRKKMELMKIYKENKNLSCQVSRGESLDRVEGAATSKLDMLYPEKMNYIVVSGEGR